MYHQWWCRPVQRMRAWQQEVAAQVVGVALPLLTLSAACLGTQITLSSHNLPFGTVVLGSQVRLKNQNDCCLHCKQDLLSMRPH